MSDGPVECPNCPGKLIYDPKHPTYRCPECKAKWNGHFPVKEHLSYHDEPDSDST